MTTAAALVATYTGSETPVLPVVDCEPRWYAAYTSANREAGLRAVEYGESRALNAVVRQHAAMVGPEGKTGYAAVSGLCLRVHGSSGPFAGAAGTRCGMSG